MHACALFADEACHHAGVLVRHAGGCDVKAPATRVIERARIGGHAHRLVQRGALVRRSKFIHWHFAPDG